MMDGNETWSGTEVTLAGIWRQSLQRSEALQPTESFFEVGGDSIMMMMMMMQISQEFGVEIAPEQVFETPTIRGLAAAIDRQRGAACSQATPELERGEL